MSSPAAQTETVGLWVRPLTETFLFGLLGQQSSSDLSLCQLKVDIPLPTTPASNFTNSTLKPPAFKKKNWIHLQDSLVSASAVNCSSIKKKKIG